MSDVSISVLDRTYNVKCNAHEVKDLQESAAYLDEQMNLMKQSAQTSSTDRIAVITALNIAHELMLMKKQQNNSIRNMSERIEHLQNKIENFLEAEEEIAV